MNQKIEFKKIDWVEVTAGMRTKMFSLAGRQLRMVEFTTEFLEIDWCTTGHIGVVLNGGLEIEFDSITVQYKKGDGIFILAGEANKHKAKVLNGAATLILVEDAKVDE